MLLQIPQPEPGVLWGAGDVSNVSVKKNMPWIIIDCHVDLFNRIMFGGEGFGVIRCLV